jgi:hypothetical protein
MGEDLWGAHHSRSKTDSVSVIKPHSTLITHSTLDQTDVVIISKFQTPLHLAMGLSPNWVIKDHKACRSATYQLPYILTPSDSLQVPNAQELKMSKSRSMEA